MSRSFTVKEANEAMRREIDKIYLEAWKQGVSVRLCLHTPQTPIVVTPAEMVEILKDKGLDL